MSVNLANYDNQGYDPGAGIVKRAIWYVVNAQLIRSWFVPISSVKCTILRLFGAKVGKGVVIKPRVNIKYPWYLVIGDHVWIGEGVWIDNLTWVNLESNVCISQDAYLVTGNHDYKDPSFGLTIGEIVIKEGGWVGARAIVCPGVRLGQGSVLTVASVLTKDAAPNGIYRGNPAERVRDRIVKDCID